MSQVESLLTDKGIPFLHKGKDYLVLCFNPEHNDSDPSMRIDVETGKYNCFSCGFHGNVFDYFNKPKNLVFLRALEIRKTIRKKLTDNKGLEIPEGATVFNEPYRGLKASTFKTAETFLHPNWDNSIVFPIRDNSNKIKAFLSRKQRKVHDGGKYNVYPYGVLPPVAPYFCKPREGKLVIVEGYMDALNLYDKGIDFVVANFGTKSTSYNNFNERYDPWLMQGLSQVYIMFDGDKAGREGAEFLKQVFDKKSDVAVEIIDLDDGEDPGMLDQESVNNLEKYLLNN